MNYLYKQWVYKIYITFFMLLIAFVIIRPFFAYFEQFLNWGQLQQTFVELKHHSGNIINIWISIRNSLIGTFIGCVIAILTGYGLAVYQFRLKSFVQFLLIITLMIPLMVNLVPIFLTLQLAEQYLQVLTQVPIVSYFANRSFAILIPFAVPALGVFVVKQYVESILNLEMLDAARIEGASEGRIFAKLILPMLSPVIAIIALIQFTGIWNSVDLSLFLIGKPEQQGLAHAVHIRQISILQNILVVVPLIVLAVSSRLIHKFINADLISQE